MATDCPVKSWRQRSVSLMGPGATTTRYHDVQVPWQRKISSTLVLFTGSLTYIVSKILRPVFSGGMSQHRVFFPGARPLEDCQRLALRIQNTHRFYLRPRILPIGPRPHPVLAQWCVELEEREAALSGWATQHKCSQQFAPVGDDLICLIKSHLCVQTLTLCANTSLMYTVAVTVTY